MAVEFDVALRQLEIAAGGDADLLQDQIDIVIISVTGCSTWMRVFISMK